MSTMLDRIRMIQHGEIPPPPVATLLGLTITSVDPGRVVFELEADAQRQANPMGTIHGGILASLADSAMGMAYASTLGEDESFTTLELKINFLRPVWSGRLTAAGRLIHGGQTVGLLECTVMDDRGRLIAQATSTCLTLRGELAKGR